MKHSPLTWWTRVFGWPACPVLLAFRLVCLADGASDRASGSPQDVRQGVAVGALFRASASAPAEPAPPSLAGAAGTPTIATGTLHWTAGEDFRYARLSVAAGGKTGFTELSAAQTGITFTNFLAEDRYLTNQILLNGSGVAAGDVDGDGWCDLYLCALERPNALYRNLGGWRFEDITARAGVACPNQPSTGAALADVDGDGDLDLLVNGVGHGTRLFLNDGRAHFTETTAEAGLDRRGGSTSLALADVDGDGDLDLYVVNYRTTTMRDEPNKRFRVSTASNRFELLTVDGRSVTEPGLLGRFTASRDGSLLENGEADILYLNDGAGRFAAVPWTNGWFRSEEDRPVSVPYDWGLSAMFHDLNQDGWPDLYVCNDFHSVDRVWINQHGRGFRALPRIALRQTSLFSMGLDVADLDRDGHDEIFVADMFSRSHARRQVQLMERMPSPSFPGWIDDQPQYSRNTLQWNRGDRTFADIAQMAGLEASDWTWCPVFLDVDLDGFEDLILVTGHVRDAQNIDIARQLEAQQRAQPMSHLDQLRLRRRFLRLEVPNLIFRSRGDLTFEEVGQPWGFSSTKVSQGIALADLDNDGDLDVVVNCLQDGPLICRNESPQPRVAVRLRGAGKNSRGIGARITVLAPGLPPQSQEMICGGRYLSSDDAVRVFAAKDDQAQVTIQVDWPGGQRRSTVAGRVNCMYEISEAGASPRTEPASAPAGTFFADMSAQLAHRHTDTMFDDFERQALLPHKLSQLGPGVGWFDIDGDGWEDLLVASGKGGPLAAFHNDGLGGFSRLTNAPFQTPVTRDQTTVLGSEPKPGQFELLAGSANYEDGITNGPVARRYLPGGQRIVDDLPGQAASTGPLALADIDGDGNLDLFVGGRVTAGRFPEPADSLIFRNVDGTLRLDEHLTAPLRRVGLVSGAVFCDLEGDGFPELALACELGPLRILRNRNGELSLWDPALSWPNPAHAPYPRLSQLTGWWNSVTSGDFDGDGRLDLAAGNWGRNTKYQSYLAAPLHNYYGPLLEDGGIGIIEAYYAPDLDKIVPWRDWETLATSLPFIRERYRNFTAFAEAGVREFLGSRFAQVVDAPVATLDSLVLLNRGDRFEVRPLPREAQLAPIFGLVVADFDGDGCEDLFAAQNFFAVSPRTSRLDAGLGVWLRGDGLGGFAAVPAQSSGLRIEGEGRGAAVADYDHDGRPDLVIGQNAQTTKLYRNMGGKPGVRVKLRGPPGNPLGIGAVLQWVSPEGRSGPVREVHAGAGYWSQDAAVQVLALPQKAGSVRVRWPGGRTITRAVPASAPEILLPSPAAALP